MLLIGVKKGLLADDVWIEAVDCRWRECYRSIRRRSAGLCWNRRSRKREAEEKRSGVLGAKLIAARGQRKKKIVRRRRQSRGAEKKQKIEIKGVTGPGTIESANLGKKRIDSDEAWVVGRRKRPDAGAGRRTNARDGGAAGTRYAEV